MSWTAPSVERRDAPHIAGEREMLEGWLEFHRGTLLGKCAGLTGEQLKTASVEPSNLTLLGLVRHMAEVERWWFRRGVARQPLDDIYCSDEHPDGDFDLVDGADPAADLRTYEAECAAARTAAAGRSLDDLFPHPRRAEDVRSVRWAYVHMIEEYARHNGHADLIRERIDGTTGA